MKSIKSALLGQKQIIDKNPDVILLQLKDIIKEHRALIINRIISDIPTYLDYKFQVKPTKELLLTVKDQLLLLKNSAVDLRQYDSILQQVLTKAVTHLTNEPFYTEIDQFIKSYVSRKEFVNGQ